MSKGYKGRNKRVSRRELIQSVKKLQRTVLDQEQRADRAERDAEKTRERIREIGFKCVDTFRGGPLEHKTINPTPIGIYCDIANDTLTDINEVMEYAKENMVRSIAEMLINENLVQFIPGDPSFPGGEFWRTRLGAKLYVVPFEKMAVWKDGVTVGNVREWQRPTDRVEWW